MKLGWIEPWQARPRLVLSQSLFRGETCFPDSSTLIKVLLYKFVTLFGDSLLLGSASRMSNNLTVVSCFMLKVAPVKEPTNADNAAHLFVIVAA